NELSSPLAASHDIHFCRVTRTLLPAVNPQLAHSIILLLFPSLSTPSVLYSHSVADGTDTVLKQQPVLGSVDLDAYTETLLWATADDGTQVPISVVCRADLHRLAGDEATAAAMAEATAASAQEEPRPVEPAPLVLYGYGSYE